MFGRIWTLFIARNKEFYRDKATLAWNFMFPFLILLGFSVIFDEDDQVLYKVGVIASVEQGTSAAGGAVAEIQYKTFLKSSFVEFIEFKTKDSALEKLTHHRLDMVIDSRSKEYWISESSPKGYMTEKLLHACAAVPQGVFEKQAISGREIPYTEWLFPGILGMNMMFNALFGVGFVVVRYRKNGVLKRMSVTPLRAYEFLVSQILSRMFLMLITTLILFVGCMMIFDFECKGSYLLLLGIFALGGFSLVAIGFLVACRSSSEEFANGMLNFISWPMMMLSEVWFSLEGAHPWVIHFSKLLPLTPLIDGARKIMNDGVGLWDLKYHIGVMAVTSIVFIALGSVLFKWQED
jgi:ABC-type multidrug transport system permease subunit